MTESYTEIIFNTFDETIELKIEQANLRARPLWPTNDKIQNYIYIYIFKCFWELIANHSVPYLCHQLTCSRLSQKPNYSQASQCLRLSTSLSVSERRPPKPTVCLLQREKSLLINLLQTAWRKWPGGCKLSLLVEDEGQKKRERGMDRGEKNQRREKKKRDREKRRSLEMDRGGRGRERKKCVCCVV